MSTTTTTPEQIGTRVGAAIARTARDEGLHGAGLTWTGIEPQDGDQFTAAGIEPNTPEWDAAEDYARIAYLAAIDAFIALLTALAPRSKALRVVQQVTDAAMEARKVRLVAEGVISAEDAARFRP